jgi:nitric oxide synthase oxygenase domain/subunit
MKPFNFDIINKLRRQNKEYIENQGVYVSANDAHHHAVGACMLWQKSAGCVIK